MNFRMAGATDFFSDGTTSLRKASSADIGEEGARSPPPGAAMGAVALGIQGATLDGQAHLPRAFVGLPQASTIFSLNSLSQLLPA